MESKDCQNMEDIRAQIDSIDKELIVFMCYNKCDLK